MKYMGSKARHAKELLSLILKDREPNQCYVEPFVGGCNVIDKVQGNRLAGDTNEYLIGMWQAVSKGWRAPVSFPEADYKIMRDNKKNYPVELVGYAGFALSYGGRFFEGWCRGKDKNNISRDYITEAYKNAEKQFPFLLGVTFVHTPYQTLNIPLKSIIYCDPPYKGTKKYSGSFDHDIFYEWCRVKVKEGHSVFVSEYDMPNDFICIWQKEVKSSLTKDTGSKTAIERLYTL